MHQLFIIFLLLGSVCALHCPVCMDIHFPRGKGGAMQSLYARMDDVSALDKFNHKLCVSERAKDLDVFRSIEACPEPDDFFHVAKCMKTNFQIKKTIDMFFTEYDLEMSVVHRMCTIIPVEEDRNGCVPGKAKVNGEVLHLVQLVSLDFITSEDMQDGQGEVCYSSGFSSSAQNLPSSRHLVLLLLSLFALHC